MATTIVGSASRDVILREIHAAYSASDDIKNVDLTKIHYLTGPVAVEGAEPGDCLVVDILDGETVSSEAERQLLTCLLQSHRSKRCHGDIL